MTRFFKPSVTVAAVITRSFDGLQKFLQAHRSELGKDLSGKTKMALLRSLNSLNRPELRKLKKPRHNLMYPDGWSTFALQFDQTRSLVQGGGGRKPAAKQDLDGIRKKITALRSQVSQTSLWQVE